MNKGSVRLVLDKEQRTCSTVMNMVKSIIRVKFKDKTRQWRKKISQIKTRIARKLMSSGGFKGEAAKDRRYERKKRHF